MFGHFQDRRPYQCKPKELLNYDLPLELLNSNDAFNNRWLHVTLDAVLLPNGRSYEYTTIRRDSVGVAAVVLNGATSSCWSRNTAILWARLPINFPAVLTPWGGSGRVHPA